MSETVQKYLEKSEEGLASSRDDLAKKRFNSCANRSYYACYQAAVALLLKHNVTPTGERGTWTHEALQAQVSILIRRRKVLPAEHKTTLPELMAARLIADYESESVSKTRAGRILKKAEKFVNLIAKETNQ